MKKKSKMYCMSKQERITTIAVSIIATLLFAGMIFGVREIIFAQRQNARICTVPNEADFWIFVRSGGMTVRIEKVLKTVGVGESIIDILKNQPKDATIYRLNGLWFEATKNGGNSRQKEGVPLSYALLSNKAVEVVGYLSGKNIQNLLGEFGDSFDAHNPYYFALWEKEGAVAGFFIEESAVKQASLEDYDYSFSPSTGIVLKLEDASFALAAREQIKTKLIESVAFTRPVVVSTQLPDKTFMQEKVLKPDAFTWEEIAVHRFKLVVDKKMIAKYNLTEQLDNFKDDIGYYYDEGLLIVGKKEDVDAILLEQRILSYPTFFYMTLEQEGDIVPPGMMGKSEALSWLQNLEARSIMIIEDRNGFYGEMRF